MTKPVISLFDSYGELTASDLAQQVLKHGFVVFDTTRPHAKELAREANEYLAAHGINAIHAAGLGPNFLSFLLDMEGKYDIQDFANWVTEFDWNTTHLL